MCQTRASIDTVSAGEIEQGGEHEQVVDMPATEGGGPMEDF